MRGIVVSFVRWVASTENVGVQVLRDSPPWGGRGIEAILSPAYLPEVSPAAAWVAAPMPAGVSV